MAKRKTYIEKKEEEIRKTLTNKRRQTKYINQLHRRGWSDMDLWDLDCAFAEFIVPRLRELKKKKDGIPCVCFSDNYTGNEKGEREKAKKKWNGIIDTMINGFAYILTDDYRYLTDEKKQEKIEPALENFKVYFGNLWW